MLTNISYPQRSIKFFENNYFNAILTGKNIYLGLLFTLFIVLIHSEKKNFAVFPPRILLLIPIPPQTGFIFSKTMVEAPQGGQRTRIPGFNLFLAFQVKDFANETYTTNTQVEGSLGLLMWHFPQGTFTGNLSLDSVNLPQQIYLLLHRDFALDRKNVCFH